MNSPMQMLQALMQGGMKNPQQAIINMVGKNNPMINNLIDMANKGNDKGIISFAENIYKEKYPNRDIKADFSEFMNTVKGQNQSK